MIELFKILLNFLTSGTSMAEDFAKPEQVRIRNAQIDEPKRQEKVQEWLEDGRKADWTARVKTLMSPSIKRNKVINHVKNLIEWGATIVKIERNDTVIRIYYTYSGEDCIDEDILTFKKIK